MAGADSKPRGAAPTVDIVVCVHNALAHVQVCFASVLRHLTPGCRLVIVNDGSGDATAAYLTALAADHLGDVALIEHPENRGYTEAANTGLRHSEADYVILLNSDTEVTAGWVERIVRCGESDPRIGIIGPLSNAASWQSVPTLLDDDGTFAINTLPTGHCPDSVAGIVAATSVCAYPRVPFINGFCFAIKRAVLAAVGPFDAAAFPRGYGEENDLCIRATDAGFALAVADDAYVYHAKSKSFGHADRIELSRSGARALEAKHGGQRMSALVAQIKSDSLLGETRNRIAAALTSARPERILFLLPVPGGGGGAHSVVQEVAAMREGGVDAQVAVPGRALDEFRRAYAGIAGSAEMFVPLDAGDVTQLAADCTVAVGTVYSSMELVREWVAANPHIVPAYYVQDYEPLFFAEGSSEHRQALASYTLVPHALLFAKTQWLIDIVSERHGVTVHKVLPSIDHNVYKPGRRKRSRAAVVVAAMIRPSTPRRGAQRTMNVLGKVQAAHPDTVQIEIFGCAPDSPEFLALAGQARVRNHGPLAREGVAEVLANADVFLDLSDYQAFGRTGLEAMACGCAVINPVLGGTDEYSIDGENSLLVDTRDEEACARALERLVVDAPLRQRLSQSGLRAAAAYSPARAAASELTVLRQQRICPHSPQSRARGRDFDRFVSRKTKPVGLALLRRRLAKLLSDPHRFLSDSQFPLVRRVAAIAAAARPSRPSRPIHDRVSAAPPRVTVIILVRDKPQLTRDCIQSLFAVTRYPNYDVTVIDNASKPETASMLAELAGTHERLTVITNAENRSFSAANNQGAAASDAELYLFLNNDTVITEPDWMTELVSEMCYRSTTAAVGPRLLFPDGRVQSAGVHVELDRDSFVSAVEVREPRPSRRVGALTAACVLIRASAFSQIGGFDERFFYGQEDVDLCLQLRQCGYELHHCAEVSVIHKESSTRKFDDNTLRNRELIRDKWRGNAADIPGVVDDAKAIGRFGMRVGPKLRKLRRDPVQFIKDAWVVRAVRDRE